MTIAITFYFQPDCWIKCRISLRPCTMLWEPLTWKGFSSPELKCETTTVLSHMSESLNLSEQIHSKTLNHSCLKRVDEWMRVEGSSYRQTLDTLILTRCDDDPFLPDTLNHFYSRFEMQNDTPAQKLPTPPNDPPTPPTVSSSCYHQEDGTGASEPAPPDCSTAFSPRLWEPWTQIIPPPSETPCKHFRQFYKPQCNMIVTSQQIALNLTPPYTTSVYNIWHLFIIF